MGRRAAGAVLGVLLVLAPLLAAAPASASPYCGQRWGSAPRVVPAMSGATVVDVRAGRHACFDRLVLDVDGRLAGYDVRYVDAVVQDGSGSVVPVRGGARLQVAAHAAVLPTDAWFTPAGELVDTSAYRTFRHVAWVGSYEGVTTVGLGVRSRLPFRAFVLPGPGTGSRLVVDVAHRWGAAGTRCELRP